MKAKPNLSAHLLWEYDFEKFNFKKSYKIVIERVLERGNLDEWREIVRFYGNQKIIETINWSAQLADRDKTFSIFFLNSDLLNVS
jgi:hypothetical protein